MLKLVTLEERQWIAKNAVIQMGQKLKYYVMDVDKVAQKIIADRQKAGMSMNVEIMPISPDMHKTPNRISTFQKDPITGVLYGIAISEDEYGNIRWQKIQLHDHLPLNLSKLDDARIWAVLRFHPDLKGSPWQLQNPYYKVYDPVETARRELTEVDAIKQAFDHIESILENPKAMVNFARFIGVELNESTNYEVVRGRLLQEARNHPFDFNKMWKYSGRAYGELFEAARSLGLIQSEVNQGFMYKGIPLGVTREEAIRTLQKDTRLSAAISERLRAEDKVVKTVEKSAESIIQVIKDRKKAQTPDPDNGKKTDGEETPVTENKNVEV